MFEFIKSLFKKPPVSATTTADTILVHTDINESIVIKEVALTDVKPKPSKRKIAPLKEVKPVEIKVVAKGVKPSTKKVAAVKSEPTKKVSAKKVAAVKPEPAKIVQLVPPVSSKKKGRPKKDKTV